MIFSQTCINNLFERKARNYNAIMTSSYNDKGVNSYNPMQAVRDLNQKEHQRLTAWRN